MLSCRGIGGDHDVLITVHSLVLLDSRCGECYGNATDPILRNSCCDGGNMTSCPATCDILLRFCQLSDLQFTSIADNRLLGTQCHGVQLVQSHAQALLGNNFESGQTYLFNETGTIGENLVSTRNPVTYTENGRWVG